MQCVRLRLYICVCVYSRSMSFYVAYVIFIPVVNDRSAVSANKRFVGMGSSVWVCVSMLTEQFAVTLQSYRLPTLFRLHFPIRQLYFVGVALNISRFLLMRLWYRIRRLASGRILRQN